MSLRRMTSRQQRIAEYYGLLSTISRLSLPYESTVREDIERILALHSASLLIATFDAPIVRQDGDRHIPRAVVTGLTPEGKLIVNRGTQATMREIDMSSQFHMSPGASA